MTVADDFCFVGGVFLECSDSLFSTGFLRYTYDSVEDEDGKDLVLWLVNAKLCMVWPGDMLILTTAGSTKAVQPSSWSKRARTNETAAEPRRMMTSWSLNCSKMSSQMGVGGSSGNAFLPCFLRESLTC